MRNLPMLTGALPLALAREALLATGGNRFAIPSYSPFASLRSNAHGPNTKAIPAIAFPG